MSREQEEQMQVGSIVQEEDRKLLYGSKPSETKRRFSIEELGLSLNLDYHVIAGAEEAVEIGDVIGYEPFGANFGWFTKVLRRANKEIDTPPES